MYGVTEYGVVGMRPPEVKANTQCLYCMTSFVIPYFIPIGAGCVVFAVCYGYPRLLSCLLPCLASLMVGVSE